MSQTPQKRLPPASLVKLGVSAAPPVKRQRASRKQSGQSSPRAVVASNAQGGPPLQPEARVAPTTNAGVLSGCVLWLHPSIPHIQAKSKPWAARVADLGGRASVHALAGCTHVVVGPGHQVSDADISALKQANSAAKHQPQPMPEVVEDRWLQCVINTRQRLPTSEFTPVRADAASAAERNGVACPVPGPRLPLGDTVVRPCQHELLARVWRPTRSPTMAHCTPAAAACTAGNGANDSIRVVTYNLLAQKFATGKTHSYCPRQHLAWSSRRARIQAELSAYRADIVCLQEVEPGVFHQELTPFFASMGMQGWFKARSPGHVEGVALFINQSAFNVMEAHTLRFSDHTQEVRAAARTDSHGWRTFTRTEGSAVMALLEHKGTGHKLIAASTHLFWDPKFPDVKVLQAAVLCNQLAAFACRAGGVARPSDLPVVLGGDFNTLPCKTQPDRIDKVLPRGGFVPGVYQLLREGQLTPSHPDYPHTRQATREGEATDDDDVDDDDDVSRGVMPNLTSAGLRLASMHHLAHGREPVLTMKTAIFAGCLDYIWISPQWLTVEATLDLPYQDNGLAADDPRLNHVSFPAIPDHTYPSDHIAIGCTLRLTADREGRKGT